MTLSILIIWPLFGAMIIGLISLYIRELGKKSKQLCASNITTKVSKSLNHTFHNNIVHDDSSYNIVRVIALLFAIVEFVISLQIFYNFQPDVSIMQFTEAVRWASSNDQNSPYQISSTPILGIDGISIYFILLTTFLIPMCILASWNNIRLKVCQYFSLFLVLEAFIVGVFSTVNLIAFYIFFEAVQIPMFLIIGIWGAEERIFAAFKFFLYTVFGSVFMLIAVLYIVVTSNSSTISDLIHIVSSYDENIQKMLWLGFFIAFAVKLPMWPVHTWLPNAHVQAPTAGSIILAGILLKFGGYGFLRISLPLLPLGTVFFADYVIILSIIAMIYASFIALAQHNMKTMIAYSSIAHMGYVTAGIFTLSMEGIEGAIVQMISHGIVSSSLFLAVGVLYDKMHSKEISFYSGLTSRMPNFAMFLMFFTMASIGLPCTSGFIGEFTVLLAVYKYKAVYGALMTLGMVLGASYMLWLYGSIMYNKINANVAKIKDICPREQLMFGLAGCLVLAIGLYPSSITDFTAASVMSLLSVMNL